MAIILLPLRSARLRTRGLLVTKTDREPTKKYGYPRRLQTSVIGQRAIPLRAFELFLKILQTT